LHFRKESKPKAGRGKVHALGKFKNLGKAGLSMHIFTNVRAQLPASKPTLDLGERGGRRFSVFVCVRHKVHLKKKV